ncbi:Fis family transcriptional regulator [Burkholderia savannae]|uniref:Fis family transcriptional regulator n=1 Tax=Burkholderia savannae TaxID=1637837 RepID=A0ABR5TEB1_9BURK|nr:T6SS effector BTH_I2691 family protein [Burkholderia savannae]KWZ43337.1 Fis family transcriptional regulator [Burkholderia savannae]
MAGSDDRCDVCKLQGLAVYPSRYAVVPKSFGAPALGSFDDKSVTGVALTQGKYGLRQLREGFVYLFYELGARGAYYWEVYSVAPDGSLWKQLDTASAKRIDAPQACRRTGHSASRLQYLVIEKPHQCGNVWVAFSEWPWSRDTVKRYGARDAQAASLRKKRMQLIEPAKWISAPKTGTYSAPLTEANLQHVIEYAPAVATTAKGEPVGLQSTELPEAVSFGELGAFRDARLQTCTSRYPWTMRNKAAAGAKLSPAAELVKHAESNSRKEKGAVCVPMMLALWDGVGITHELNGFRNDAQARFLQYCDEQALRINALQWIDQAKLAVEAGARRKATFDHSPATPGSTSWYYPDAVAKQKAAAKTPADQQFWSDYQWMGENGVPPSYARQITQFRAAPSSPAYQDAMTRARKYVEAKPRIEENRARRIDQDTATGSVQDWSKYREKLADDTSGKPGSAKGNVKRIDVFRILYQRIQDQKQALLAQRTADVANWLDAPLFLVGLEDYHDQNGFDGVAFEFVIFHAIVGLSADSSGVAALNKLIDRLDPTKPESLIWRMVASNQKESKEALKLALARAEAHKTTLLGMAGEGFNAFAEACEKLKKFAEFYGKMDEMSKQAKQLNAVDQAMHDKGVDKAAVSVGHLIFQRFSFKGFNLQNLGNGVSEAIINSVFMLRVGIKSDEVKELVLLQAKIEPQLRSKFLGEYQAQRRMGRSSPEAFRMATSAVAETEGSNVLSRRWRAIKVRESVGLVGVIGLIEVFALIKLINKKDKEKRDWAELGGACFSVAGAAAEVALKPMEALRFEEGAKKFKIFGGYCGALAAGVGTALDILDTTQKWEHGEKLVSFLYGMKAGLGLGATIAFGLTALSSSAPVFERFASNITGRQIRIVILDRIGQGIADATARKVAIAAGERVATVAAERVGAMVLGRGLLYMASWQVQVAIVAIQVVIWYFGNDDLQNSLNDSVFGVGKQYKNNDDLKKQDEAFDKALVAIGFKDDATSGAEEAKSHG